MSGCSLVPTQVSYLYTNYPEERLPLDVLCDVLSQPAAVDVQLGSAMTIIPCKESDDDVGYLIFASGPDLCTLCMYDQSSNS